MNFLARGTSSDLSLDKTVDDASPDVGSNVTFTLTVTNDGPYTVLGVTVSDPLPPGLTFVSAAPPPNTDYDSTTGLWSVGSLGNGDSIVLDDRGHRHRHFPGHQLRRDRHCRPVGIPTRHRATPVRTKTTTMPSLSPANRRARTCR